MGEVDSSVCFCQVRPLGRLALGRRYVAYHCVIGISQPCTGFQIDAQTVLDYLLNHEVFAKTPIVGGREHNRRFSTIDG